MTLTAESLVAYLTDMLNVEGPLDAETELFSSGLLDSVAMVNLIAHIEDQARIEVRPSDVTLDNFDTIARILAYARQA
ncbi:acyl carrier protein [Neotabrizicola shimadae]|uniref:Acyl carrier protein n=1 Tax=Neotabrizicola shimadae TaxID=2807096 RepID=A0A8G0ZTG8_9RHOB|nr:phosphopantetheine-binding protein [Neotabrizicola shimadae]QYZ68616.1 acyl carrier protein [Neotabrizicola shimadae]